jgi:hypothetical protein
MQHWVERTPPAVAFWNLRKRQVPQAAARQVVVELKSGFRGLWETPEHQQGIAVR